MGRASQQACAHHNRDGFHYLSPGILQSYISVLWIYGEFADVRMEFPCQCPPGFGNIKGSLTFRRLQTFQLRRLAVLI